MLPWLLLYLLDYIQYYANDCLMTIQSHTVQDVPSLMCSQLIRKISHCIDLSSLYIKTFVFCIVYEYWFFMPCQEVKYKKGVLPMMKINFVYESIIISIFYLKAHYTVFNAVWLGSPLHYEGPCNSGKEYTTQKSRIWKRKRIPPELWKWPEYFEKYPKIWKDFWPERKTENGNFLSFKKNFGF